MSSSLSAGAAALAAMNDEERFLHWFGIVQFYLDAMKGKDFGGDWEAIAQLCLWMTAAAEREAEVRKTNVP